MESNIVSQNIFNFVLKLRQDYPSTTNCLDVKKSIEKIISEKAYYSVKDNSDEIIAGLDIRLKELNDYFAQQNCAMVIGNTQLGDTTQIAEKYNNLAKQRIENDSKKQVKNRIIIASVVLIVSLGIIIFVSKKVVK
jgi:hypothetical protein